MATQTASVILPSDFGQFDFKRIRLARPISLMTASDATFFIKLSINEDRPLVIQTTKCTTKKGIVKSSKKYYIDLIFDNYSEAIIKWLEGLEEYCKQEIVTGAGSDSWFAEQPTMDDIDVLYTPIIKVKGRTYFMTTTIKTDDARDLPLVKIYNEDYKDVPWGEVGANTQFNTLLEIKGIRFSTRKIFIEIETKHIMILDDEKMFDTYLISSTKGGSSKGASESNNASSNEIEGDTLHLELEGYESMMQDSLSDVAATATASEEETLGGDHPMQETTQYMPQEENGMYDLEELVLDVPPLDAPVEVIESKETLFLKMYRDVKQKLKDSKRGAIIAYLTAKNIKNVDIVEMQELNDEFDDEIDELDPLSLDPRNSVL